MPSSLHWGAFQGVLDMIKSDENYLAVDPYNPNYVAFDKLDVMPPLRLVPEQLGTS